MLAREKRYSDILIRAGLFNQIPVDQAVDAIASLIKELGCIIDMSEYSLKHRLKICMKLFETVLGEELLDGESITLLMLRLEEYIAVVKAEKDLNNEVVLEWLAKESMIFNKHGKKLINDESAQRLKIYLSSVKKNGNIIFSRLTFYKILIPIMLVVAKLSDDLQSFSIDFWGADFFECQKGEAYGDFPSIDELNILEKLYLEKQQYAFFISFDVIGKYYEKYFLSYFLTRLPQKAFYQQPRNSDESRRYQLRRTDVGVVSKQLKPKHDELLDLVERINRLSDRQDAKDDRLELKRKFINLFKRFKQAEKKLNSEILQKRQKLKLPNYYMLIEKVKWLVNQDCWSYKQPDPVELMIMALVKKYRDAIDQSEKEIECYLSIKEIAKTESEALAARLNFLSVEEREQSDLNDFVFKLNEAILANDIDTLHDIFKMEVLYPDIMKFLVEFVDHPFWFFQEDDQIKTIANALADYKKVLTQFTSPRQAIHAVWKMSAKQERLMRQQLSIQMKSEDVMSDLSSDQIMLVLHQMMNGCNKDALDNFREKIEDQYLSRHFGKEFRRFLEDDCWRDSSLISERRWVCGAVAQYQRLLPSFTIDQALYAKARESAELALSSAAYAGHGFFSLIYQQNKEVILLHSAVRDRDTGKLESLLKMMAKPSQKSMQERQFGGSTEVSSSFSRYYSYRKKE